MKSQIVVEGRGSLGERSADKDEEHKNASTRRVRYSLEAIVEREIRELEDDDDDDDECVCIS